MHIVFLTHEYPKKGHVHGGVGSFVEFLAKKLVELGNSVSVVGINNISKNEDSVDNGVNIYRVKKSNWSFGSFYQNNKRLLKKLSEIHIKHSIDIVEGSEMSFAFFPKNTPYVKVIRMHGGHHFFSYELGKKPHFWKVHQEKKSFLKADYYIAVSDYVGNKTKGYLNSNFKFKKIFNSINVNKFPKSNPLKTQKHLLLFVGTVCEKKGIRQLVLAMPKIKASYPKIKLAIVGRDWFFPNGDSYIEYLKTFISEEVKDNIEIVGPISHDKVSNLIEKAEICVFPSHMEAMPIAWLESLLMGKPTIVGDIGPAKEAIIENETGLLVNPYEPDDIADKILLLLDNPERGLLLGDNARNDILKRFNQDYIVKENVEYYKSLL